MRWLLGIGLLFAAFAVANWWIVLRPLSRIDAALEAEQAEGGHLIRTLGPLPRFPGETVEAPHDYWQEVLASKARHPSARGVCAICGRSHAGSYRETPWAP